MKKQKPKTLILLVIAIILIIFLSSYIIKIKYTQKQQQKNSLIYQQGLQDGYTQAVIQIMQQSQLCQPFPVFAGNTTVNLVNTACLNLNRP